MEILAIVGACIALLAGFVSLALGHHYLGAGALVLSVALFTRDIFLLNRNAGVRCGHTLFVGCLVGTFSLFGLWISSSTEIAVLATAVIFILTWGTLEWFRRKTRAGKTKGL